MAASSRRAASGGSGVVIGTEYEANKASAARAHFEQAGLSGFIDLREGDLRETLRQIDGPVDFMLVDIWITMARPALELVTQFVDRLAEQMFSRAVNEPKPVLGIESENGHVNFRHDRAQQRSRFEGAETLRAQGFAEPRPAPTCGLVFPPKSAVLPPPGAGVFPLRHRAVGRHRKVKLGDWRQPPQPAAARRPGRAPPGRCSGPAPGSPARR